MDRTMNDNGLHSTMEDTTISNSYVGSHVLDENSSSKHSDSSDSSDTPMVQERQTRGRSRIRKHKCRRVRPRCKGCYASARRAGHITKTDCCSRCEIKPIYFTGQFTSEHWTKRPKYDIFSNVATGQEHNYLLHYDSDDKDNSDDSSIGYSTSTSDDSDPCEDSSPERPPARRGQLYRQVIIIYIYAIYHIVNHCLTIVFFIISWCGCSLPGSMYYCPLCEKRRRQDLMKRGIFNTNGSVCSLHGDVP